MRRLGIALLAVLATAVLSPVALAAAPPFVPPASHETSLRAEWDLTGPGAPSSPDTFLTAWTPVTTGQTAPAEVKGTFSTNRFTCDTSTDTWRFRWSYGWFQVPRSSLSVSGRDATLTASFPVETRENAGSGCATADRYASPGTLIASGTATLTAGWSVEGDWQSGRTCWLSQAKDLLYVATSRSVDDVAAWLTLSGSVALSAGADRLTSGSLWRTMTSARPNNGQWPCGDR